MAAQGRAQELRAEAKKIEAETQRLRAENERARIAGRIHIWSLVVRAVAWIAGTAVATIPISVVMDAFETAAGKETSIRVDIAVTLSISLAGLNGLQALKAKRQKREIKRLRRDHERLKAAHAELQEEHASLRLAAGD